MGSAALVYGALVESKKLRLERRVLPLPHWPDRLHGYRVAVLADMHLRSAQSIELGRQAVAMALDAEPDMVVLAGDIVAFWDEGSEDALADVLEPLLLLNGAALAVPGNREYWNGEPERLRPVLERLNIRLLRNQAWVRDGIQWVGIDSANMHAADPFLAFSDRIGDEPTLVVWHEPDLVGWLEPGASLMISGHTHGGQFRLPNGWAPKRTRNGSRYLDGFYPEAPTPLYVSRGIGTTGPPSRLFCPPEVSLLELVGIAE